MGGAVWSSAQGLHIVWWPSWSRHSHLTGRFQCHRSFSVWTQCLNPVTCVAEDSNVAGVTRLPPLRVVVRHLEFGSKCSILQGSLFMTAHAICQIQHWRSEQCAFDRLQHWKQQSTSCRRHSHRPDISLTCGHGLERHRSIRKNIFCSSSSHSHVMPLSRWTMYSSIENDCQILPV